MSLLSSYKKVRQYSLEQVSFLKTEDFVVQPIEFVSPPKWNLAHTTWFFEEFILKVNKADYKIFHKDFSFLFNSYYVNAGDRLIRGHRGALTRPELEKVLEYREYVDREMKSLLNQVESGTDLYTMIVLGLNHEQQHQELFLTDIKYILGFQPLFPEYNKEALCEKGNAGESDWVKTDEGIFEIGFEGNRFSYDNELGKHKTYLQNFEIRKKLVSNGEYLEFINDGAYKNPDLWHSEGWAWLNVENVRGPLYWHWKDNEWHQYTLAGLRKVNPEHPVSHISYFEAFAYSQWAGYRLPTEFEWEAASNLFDWGDRWEWTESAYLPYPGYKKAAGAVGEYNGKFMVNQKVLRGSSVATSEGHSRKTYRNFFHPHLSWQFTGIRLAR